MGHQKEPVLVQNVHRERRNGRVRRSVAVLRVTSPVVMMMMMMIMMMMVVVVVVVMVMGMIVIKTKDRGDDGNVDGETRLVMVMPGYIGDN